MLTAVIAALVVVLPVALCMYWTREWCYRACRCRGWCCACWDGCCDDGCDAYRDCWNNNRPIPRSLIPSAELDAPALAPPPQLRPHGRSEFEEL